MLEESILQFFLNLNEIHTAVALINLATTLLLLKGLMVNSCLLWHRHVFILVLFCYVLNEMIHGIIHSWLSLDAFIPTFIFLAFLVVLCMNANVFYSGPTCLVLFFPCLCILKSGIIIYTESAYFTMHHFHSFLYLVEKQLL